MMKKLLAFLVLAAAPLLADNAHLTHYGYFWVNTGQTLTAVTSGVYSAVTWDSTEDVTTHEVYLDSSDHTSIVLEDTGVYQVFFTINASNLAVANYRIALLLNGVEVQGSIYGVETSGAGVVGQLNGYVIFSVTQKNSLLQLVNDTANNVKLASITGPTGEANSVSASLQVIKINK